MNLLIYLRFLTKSLAKIFNAPTLFFFASLRNSFFNLVSSLTRRVFSRSSSRTARFTTRRCSLICSSSVGFELDRPMAKNSPNASCCVLDFFLSIKIHPFHEPCRIRRASLLFVNGNHRLGYNTTSLFCIYTANLESTQCLSHF